LKAFGKYLRAIGLADITFDSYVDARWPARSHEDGARADGDLPADLQQMDGHGLRIGAGQDQRRRRPPDGAKPRRGYRRIHSVGARAFGPDGHQHFPLADSSFVLNPD
jgi:hypothetical protein